MYKIIYPLLEGLQLEAGCPSLWDACIWILALSRQKASMGLSNSRKSIKVGKKRAFPSFCIWHIPYNQLIGAITQVLFKIKGPQISKGLKKLALATQHIFEQVLDIYRIIPLGLPILCIFHKGTLR